MPDPLNSLASRVGLRQGAYLLQSQFLQHGRKVLLQIFEVDQVVELVVIQPGLAVVGQFVELVEIGVDSVHLSEA